MKCCICGTQIAPAGDWTKGNNAEPVVRKGRCCNECNYAVVIPARLGGNLIRLKSIRKEIAARESGKRVRK